MPTKTFLDLPSQKQERIMNAALTMFNRDGYDQSSVATLVKDAGIPRGSFYMYFEDLTDVFKHLLLEVQQHKLAYMMPVMKRLESTPFLDVYTDIVRAGLHFAQAYPQYYALGLQIYRSHALSMHAFFQPLEQQGMAMMAEWLKRDQHNGSIVEGVNTELIARMLYRFNAFELSELFYQGETEETLIELTEDFITIVKQGCLKEDSHG